MKETATYKIPYPEPADPIAITDDLGSMAAAIENGLATVAKDASTIGNGKAPISHASAGTTYGAATNSLYGHVKLYNAVGTQTDGAITPAAVNAVNDKLAKYAPKMHSEYSATSSCSYGTAGEGLFGHVKLMDSVSTAYDSSSGVAITPAGVTSLFEFDNANMNNTLSGWFGGCVVNKQKNLFKLYGRWAPTSAQGRVAVPGIANTYGVRATLGAPLGANRDAMLIYCGGMFKQGDNYYQTSLAVGSDGNIYFEPSSSSNSIASGIIALYPACIYIAADFGDTTD